MKLRQPLRQCLGKGGMPWLFAFLLGSCLLPDSGHTDTKAFNPKFRLIPSDSFYFQSFVDCNMAETWVGDTFRIFPGKYGEDPIWGFSDKLLFADGHHADEAFLAPMESFKKPTLPPVAKPGTNGLHGAIWFETIFKNPNDSNPHTLYTLYHNENYPSTLPFDSLTGEGYQDKDWPVGLGKKDSKASVCRIGLMRSTNGGYSWTNLGIVLEDLQPRLILKPHNNAITFAGGVGDPSAVVCGSYLYIFYSEYGYPGQYDASNYSRETEWKGQCISVARIALSALDNPLGKVYRWDGNQFSAPWNGIGKPIQALQIPMNEGGGPVTNSLDTTYSFFDNLLHRIAYMTKKAQYGYSAGAYHWGPSISWNDYLECWVMVMSKVIGPHFQGHQLYISFNPHKDLGNGRNAQDWTKPQLLFQQYGSCLWYPSLQPMDTPEDIQLKRTSLHLGKRARFFFKQRYMKDPNYISSYIVEFEK